MSTFADSIQGNCPVNECGCFKIDGLRRLPCESFLGTYYSERHCVNCGHVEASHVRRKPPHKLADGTWSDGVDREYRVRANAFGRVNMERYAVLTCKCHGGWSVYKGVSGLTSFDTHAKAIAYADKEARK